MLIERNDMAEMVVKSAAFIVYSHQKNITVFVVLKNLYKEYFMLKRVISALSVAALCITTAQAATSLEGYVNGKQISVNNGSETEHTYYMTHTLGSSTTYRVIIQNPNSNDCRAIIDALDSSMEDQKKIKYYNADKSGTRVYHTTGDKAHVTRFYDFNAQ